MQTYIWNFCTCCRCRRRRRSLVFHFLGVSACGMWYATLSIYLSIFLFVSFILYVTFFFVIVQVYQCIDTKQMENLQEMALFFILNVWTCANSVIHNFMRHSFCYHLLSLSWLLLSLSIYLSVFLRSGLTVVCYSFFVRVATIFSFTFSNVA